MTRTLVSKLISDGWLKTDRLIKAFRVVKRRDFLPQAKKDLAGLDQPLDIGWGQTISQPAVVAFMLELLKPEPGDKILDVGFGSGWTTALLGQIVGERGRVIAIERIPQLKEFGESNVARYGLIDQGIVNCVCGDGSQGYAKEAPFDKILCSATVKGRIPEAWEEQLKPGGWIVTPMGSSIWGSSICVFKKKKDGIIKEQEHPGFLFVPLVKDKRARGKF